MNILFCGGGTLGPVTPLLAVSRNLKRLSTLDFRLSFAWVGTPVGPEAPLVARERIPFMGIPVAKLPRYFSFEWLTQPREFLREKRMARHILDNIRPDLIVGAGGYASARDARGGETRDPLRDPSA